MLPFVRLRRAFSVTLQATVRLTGLGFAGVKCINMQLGTTLGFQKFCSLLTKQGLDTPVLSCQLRRKPPEQPWASCSRADEALGCVKVLLVVP